MDQNTLINDANNFFTKNKVKYDVLSNFKKFLLNLSQDTFNDIINFVQSNKEIIFKNHKNALFFYFNITLESEYHFKIFELYLDIIIHFQKEIKNAGLTENEMISLLFRYNPGINYLFSKNFFSIETIVDISFQNIYIFINFLPEIEEYDLEYAQKREKNIMNDISSQDLDFYHFVKNNRQAHILNRSKYYHPSQLHKLIRDDDYKSFQIYLTKNNTNINSKIEFSYYERSITIEKDLSLIKLAATYGSINVFKYLWLQDDIYIDNDLLLFAYFGRNFDIIHLCEKKCQSEVLQSQAILTNQNDLLNYYLDNFEDEIYEKIEQITDQVKNFKEDDSNPFKSLTYDDLCSALFSFNFDIIQYSLPKIAFINKTVEMKSVSDDLFTLSNSKYDMDLFEFLYEYKINTNNTLKNHYNILSHCIIHAANDAFKFCFKFIWNNKCFCNEYLIKCFKKNHDLANYLLDLMISSHDDYYFDDCLFYYAIQNYNEDVVVKLFLLFNRYLYKSSFQSIIHNLTIYLSNKMICNLFNRITFLPKDLLNICASIFLENGNDAISNHIKNLLNE